MRNIPGSLTVEGRFDNPRDVVVLTSTAIVSLDLTTPKLYTLIMTQDTTINLIGSPAANNYIQGTNCSIRITGNFKLRFVQSGFVFEGSFITAGELISYKSNAINLVTIVCNIPSTNTFEVIHNPLYT